MRPKGAFNGGGRALSLDVQELRSRYGGLTLDVRALSLDVRELTLMYGALSLDVRELRSTYGH